MEQVVSYLIGLAAGSIGWILILLMAASLLWQIVKGKKKMSSEKNEVGIRVLLPAGATSAVVTLIFENPPPPLKQVLIAYSTAETKVTMESLRETEDVPVNLEDEIPF